MVKQEEQPEQEQEEREEKVKKKKKKKKTKNQKKRKEEEEEEEDEAEEAEEEEGKPAKASSQPSFLASCFRPCISFILLFFGFSPLKQKEACPEETEEEDEAEQAEEEDDVDNFFKAMDRNRAAKRKKKYPNAPPEPEGRSCCFWATIVVVLVSVILGIALHDSDDYEGRVESRTEQDHYEVLGSERGASAKEIKRQFRKQALRWHPDKNLGCGQECDDKLAALNDAYRVLSSTKLRAAYDKANVAFELLVSDAVDLDQSNFQSLVLESDYIWFVQVYSDWHRSCISFSPIWEEVVLKYGDRFKFGRLHLKDDEALVRTLPIGFGAVPSVVSFVGGGYHESSLFVDGARSGRQLEAFIDQEVPNSVFEVPLQPLDDALQYLRATQAGRARVLFLTKRHRSSAPLSLRVLAHQFGDIDLAQVSKGGANTLSTLFKQLADTYPGAPARPSAAIYAMPDGSIHWNTERLDQRAIVRLLVKIRKQLVPTLSGAGVVHACMPVKAHVRMPVCVLLTACTKTAAPEQLVADFREMAHSSKDPSILFAFANGFQTDLAPLCELTADEHPFRIVTIDDDGSQLSLLQTGNVGSLSMSDLGDKVASSSRAVLASCAMPHIAVTHSAGWVTIGGISVPAYPLYATLCCLLAFRIVWALNQVCTQAAWVCLLQMLMASAILGGLFYKAGLFANMFH